jgi:hypothetical protein
VSHTHPYSFIKILRIREKQKKYNATKGTKKEIRDRHKKKLRIHELKPNNKL